MRKIRFRGKRIDNGEWAYGYYCLTRFCWTPIPGTPEDAYAKRCVRLNNSRMYFAAIQEADNPSSIVEVDPSSVGEFTGLPDKNSVEIYEGDIVRVQDRDYDPGDVSEHVIKWGGDYPAFELDPPTSAAGECNCLQEALINRQVEVIGNIHNACLKEAGK